MDQRTCPHCDAVPRGWTAECTMCGEDIFFECETAQCPCHTRLAPLVGDQSDAA